MSLFAIRPNPKNVVRAVCPTCGRDPCALDVHRRLKAEAEASWIRFCVFVLGLIVVAGLLLSRTWGTP